MVIRPFFLPMANSPWDEEAVNTFTQVDFDYAAVLGYGVSPEGRPTSRPSTSCPPTRRWSASSPGGGRGLPPAPGHLLRPPSEPGPPEELRPVPLPGRADDRGPGVSVRQNGVLLQQPVSGPGPSGPFCPGCKKGTCRAARSFLLSKFPPFPWETAPLNFTQILRDPYKMSGKNGGKTMADRLY